jgi:hypothetical protein
MQHENQRAGIAIVFHEHNEEFRTGDSLTAICAIASPTDR